MIKLYKGDCLEVMKTIEDSSIDSIITDPPYGMNFQSNRRINKHPKITLDNNLKWLDEFAQTCFALAKNNTAHYIFCSFHNVDKFKVAFEKHFKLKNILIWEKDNHSMGDLKGNFSSKYEMILFLHKGRRLINGKRDSNVLKFKRTGNKLHPTQKPIALMEFLIEKFSDEDDIIIDPFMGSGSTMVACQNTNRNGIGIEMNDKYFEIAKKRTSTYGRQLTL